MKKLSIIIIPVLSFFISYNTFADDSESSVQRVRICNHTNPSIGLILKVEQESYSSDYKSTQIIRTKKLSARECTHMNYDKDSPPPITPTQFIRVTETGNAHPPGETWPEFFIVSIYVSSKIGDDFLTYAPDFKPEYMEDGEYHCDVLDDDYYNLNCNGWERHS